MLENHSLFAASFSFAGQGFILFAILFANQTDAINKTENKTIGEKESNAYRANAKITSKNLVDICFGEIRATNVPAGILRNPSKKPP